MSRLALLRAASLPFGSLGGLGGDALATATRERLLAARAVEEHAAALTGPLFDAAGPAAGDAQGTPARFAMLRLRRAVHAHQGPHAGDLDAAAPLLGGRLRAGLAAYEAALARVADAQAAYDAAHADALARARRALCAVAVAPVVQHGMALASRSLVPKVQRLAASDPSRWRHEERHTAAKAAAYVVRSCTKTSPNGVFCAVAPAWVAGTTASVEGTGGVARTEVLLSLSEVRKVTACLAADPDVADAVIPRPNPTLREAAGEWTWWRPATLREPTDDEVHARARDQPVLRAFVDEAARGIHATEALLDAVAGRTGHDPAELRRFFERLVAAGILLAELEVPWSSRRRFRDLAALARRRGARAEWIATLDHIEDQVDRLAALPFPERAPAMERIVHDVATLPRRRAFRPDELFRVDSASALRVRLPERVLEDLGQTMSRLAPLLGVLYPREVQHRRLIRRYLQHQPPDDDVPFIDVYGSLAEAPEADSARAGLMEFDPGPQASPAARRVRDWFVSQAAAAAPGDPVEVTLETGDEPRWNAGVLFQVAARVPEDIDAGRYSLVINGVFNGVGLALSRFAHLLQGSGDGGRGGAGPVVAELRRAWSSSERPGAVLAELTYNHEARTANAGLRPVLFDREIELPGDLVSAGVERVPLSDLVIRYDSAKDRLVLRSARTGLEIVPVLSSGVSPAGIVSSLIHIGRQGLQAMGWLPGFHAPGIVHWPRFRCGRVVLFRERWVFARPQLPPPDAAEAAYYLEVARWREAHHLPRHVFVHTTAETKPFYVDLESPVLVDLLRRASAAIATDDAARLVVTEMLPGPEELWVRDAAGAYATEFLVQMESAERAVSTEPRAIVATGSRA